MEVEDKENSKPLFGFYLIYYAIIRFILEFLRGDMERGGIWVLSTSQIISIVVLPIGLWILFGRRLKVDRKA
jgi:phosphatidylglycerol:prolipoprotein diacylglycerol transferase